MAERKVEILETLVTVSHEITSTLNLERMLQTIVNAPQPVIRYERAPIALEHRGRFKLSAVTGDSRSGLQTTGVPLKKRVAAKPGRSSDQRWK